MNEWVVANPAGYTLVHGSAEECLRYIDNAQLTIDQVDSKSFTIWVAGEGCEDCNDD